MNLKIKFLLLIFAASTVFFSACNKTELVELAEVNELTPSQNEKSLSEASPSANALSMPALNVQEGMLVFKNDEELSRSKYILANMADEELVVFENKIGFTSLHSVNGKLYNLIETGVDSSDLYLFAQKNPKFFEIANGKRKYDCVWARYTTNLTVNDLRFKFGVYQKNDNYNDVLFYQYYPTNAYNIDIVREAREIVIYTEQVESVGKVPAAFLVDYYCKVTSRGVDGRFVELPHSKFNLYD